MKDLKIFIQDKTLENRNKVIISNLPLIKRIASRHINNGSEFELDDLVSFGVLGLIRGLDMHNGSTYTSTYLYTKIKSGIFDNMRKYGKFKKKYYDYYEFIDIDKISNFLIDDREQVEEYFLKQNLREKVQFAIDTILSEHEKIAIEVFYCKKVYPDIVRKSVRYWGFKRQTALKKLRYYFEKEKAA